MQFFAERRGASGATEPAAAVKIRSMTGFGRAQRRRSGATGRRSIVARSVNHRFLDLTVKARETEARARAVAAARRSPGTSRAGQGRGRAARPTRASAAGRAVDVDEGLLEALLARFAALSTKYPGRRAARGAGPARDPAARLRRGRGGRLLGRGGRGARERSPESAAARSGRDAGSRRARSSAPTLGARGATLQEKPSGASRPAGTRSSAGSRRRCGSGSRRSFADVPLDSGPARAGGGARGRPVGRRRGAAAARRAPRSVRRAARAADRARRQEARVPLAGDPAGAQHARVQGAGSRASSATCST